jgi:hypothetical protein
MHLLARSPCALGRSPVQRGGGRGRTLCTSRRPPRPAALAATYVKARIGESASPIQQGGGTVPAGDWLDVAMRLTSDAHCFVVLRYSTYEFGGESHKYPCVPSPYLSLLSRAIVL